MPTNNRPQCHTILTAERVIADESIKAAVLSIWQVLLTLNLQCHIQIPDTLFQPLHTYFVTILPKEGIHLILMNDTPQPIHQRARQELCLRSHLSFQNAINVDRFLRDRRHFSTQNTYKVQK